MKKAKYIHFVGIKGVGMAALAILAKEAGIKVTGSDIADRFVTDNFLKQAGISWKVGFSPKNIEGRPDLVVVTGAWGGMENPEAQSAKNSGIETIMQGQAVGAFMDGKFLGRNYEGISVAGTHGKTTTAAMLAEIFAKNNFDPSYVVGCGGISNLGASGHFGKGKYFVAEADEYATCPQTDKTPKFLWQNPKISIVTNIEYDHPDVFADIGQVKEAFLKFMLKLPKNGLLVAGGDSPNVGSLLREVSCPVVTFGQGARNDWRFNNFSTRDGLIRFWVENQGKSLGNFQLLVPGKFNAANALSTIIIGLELGIPVEKIRKSLAEFRGTKRRFEFVGEASGIKLYDDYAHHPTEISSTLAAAKEFFSGQKITCIFQPHTYSRTKALLSEFARCFPSGVEVLIADIYASARETSDFGIDSKVLTEEIAKHHPQVKYLGTKEKVLDYLKKKVVSEEVVLTMGAGDIFLWHEEMLDVIKSYVR